MGKYKEHSYEQKVMLPIDFSEQVLPGTFEYTLNFLIDRVKIGVFLQPRYADPASAEK